MNKIHKGSYKVHTSTKSQLAPKTFHTLLISLAANSNEPNPPRRNKIRYTSETVQRHSVDKFPRRLQLSVLHKARNYIDDVSPQSETATRETQHIAPRSRSSLPLGLWPNGLHVRAAYFLRARSVNKGAVACSVLPGASLISPLTRGRELERESSVFGGVSSSLSLLRVRADIDPETV